MRYLTPPPTSTDCERLFSMAGQIMDEKQANLLPDNLKKILFLRENIVISNLSLNWLRLNKLFITGNNYFIVFIIIFCVKDMARV